jgi:hypothetical protein
MGVRLEANERKRKMTGERKSEKGNTMQELTPTGQPQAGKAGIYEQITPAEHEVNLKQLLQTIESTIKAHVVIAEDAAKALAAWVLHTYVFVEREAVAYVAIQSPEKRCGKTTLLSVLAGLASKPLVASNISVGAFFRAIDEAHPTLMIDEADTFLGRNSAMRGILNAGNTRRTAFVLRLARSNAKEQPEGGQQEDRQPSIVVRFSCWCPKVIAMIGRVPETLADRSIVVNMERKLVSERCVPLAEFNPGPIKSACKRWADDHAKQVREWPRRVLPEVNDRASDTFEPLLVIAEMAGADVYEKVTQAAIRLCGHANTEPEAAGLMLDIMTVFIFRKTNRVFSRDLAEALKGKSGWIAYDVTSRGAVTELSIATTLRKYGIRPTTVRIGPEVSKGYKWEDFRQALDHYVPKQEVERKLQELHAMNDLAFEAQKEKEALAAAKAAQEAVDGQKEEEAVEQIMASIEGANDREQLIEDLTDLMKGGKLDVTKCNGV